VFVLLDDVLEEGKDIDLKPHKTQAQHGVRGQWANQHL
jgi:hypothetical protein